MRLENITTGKIALALGLVASVVSCERDATETADKALLGLKPAEEKSTKNLPVNTKTSEEYTKFSFAKNAVVAPDSNEWDIAFRGTTIIVNGGGVVKADNKEPLRFVRVNGKKNKGNAGILSVSGSFAAITQIDATKLRQDSITQKDKKPALALEASSGKGWYDYNSTTHIITPSKGKILLIRTYDNKFVKMQISSYYQDAPAVPTATSKPGFYSFVYSYQANGTANF